MPATGGVLACESCFLFHVQEEQVWPQVLLVALAVACAVGAVLLLVRAARRRGREGAGSLLVAAGLIVVPLAMVPLTTTQVIHDLPYVTTASGVRVRAASFADCDKPLYASWNLQADMPTESGRVAQQACRDAAASAQRTTALLLVLAVGLVVAGAVVGRSARSRGRDDEGEPQDSAASR